MSISGTISSVCLLPWKLFHVVQRLASFRCDKVQHQRTASRLYVNNSSRTWKYKPIRNLARSIPEFLRISNSNFIPKMEFKIQNQANGDGAFGETVQKVGNTANKWSGKHEIKAFAIILSFNGIIIAVKIGLNSIICMIFMIFIIMILGGLEIEYIIRYGAAIFKDVSLINKNYRSLGQPAKHDNEQHQIFLRITAPVIVDSFVVSLFSVKVRLLQINTLSQNYV